MKELVRERDFYRAKHEELKSKIKTLEYDNAELIKRDQVLSKRLEELSSLKSFRQKKPRVN